MTRNSVTVYINCSDHEMPPLFKVVVEQIEVASDDRYWHDNDDHPCKSTEGRHQHPLNRYRIYVTIAYGCHGNQCPPEASGDCVELRVRVIHFTVIYDDAENEDEDKNEE